MWASLFLLTVAATSALAGCAEQARWLCNVRSALSHSVNACVVAFLCACRFLSHPFQQLALLFFSFFFCSALCQLFAATGCESCS